jgi:hypothetical protein
LAGYIVTGFWGYQLFMIMSGTTTNEVGKRADLRRALAQQQEQHRQQGAPGVASTPGGAGAGAGPAEDPSWMAEVAAGLEHNPYNRGALANLAEVLFPRCHLVRAARRRKAR